MENKAHALAAGAFVVLVTALLLALGWWLSRDGAVRRPYELSSADAVTRLQPQAAVRFKGVPVGKVTDISFDPKVPGNVLVRIAVDAAAPVSQATFATLGYQGVTGIAHVQLDDDAESPGAGKPLEVVDGEPPRIPLRPSLVGRLAEQGAALLVQVEAATRNINRLLSAENQKTLMDTVRNTGDAARGIQQLSDDVRAVLVAPTGVARVSVPEVMGAARDTLQSIQATSVETRNTVAEAGKVVQQLSVKGGAIDKLAGSADALTQSANALNDSTLPRVNRASDSTTRTARQLERTASQLNENPQSLLYGNAPVAPGPGETGFVAPAAAR